MDQVKKKRKKWTRFRHKIVQELAFCVLKPYTQLRYGTKVERFREQGDRAYLILLNHQTPLDQFLVGMAFKRPIYFLATEDIFSLGWISSLLRWAVAPIPIKKQTTDVQAVMTCIRVAKEGGTLCIAPEGNRTYSGRTEYMNPAIAAMAQKLKLPIALFRIEGGYGVEPRWSSVVRRGPSRAYVSRVIEPEEYQTMSKEELAAAVAEGLYVDETKVGGSYAHKQRAEYMERAFYVCPDCGLSAFESCDDIVRCRKCDWRIRYLPTKELEGVDKPFPHRYAADWYDAQCRFVSELNLENWVEEPMFEDVANLSEVVVYSHKQLVEENVPVALYGDRIVLKLRSGEQVFRFDETTALSVLGRNKLNIYYDKKVYQLKGDKRFNALKYVNIYYRSKNLDRSDGNGKFLGL